MRIGIKNVSFLFYFINHRFCDSFCRQHFHHCTSRPELAIFFGSDQFKNKDKLSIKQRQKDKYKKRQTDKQSNRRNRDKML